MKPILIAGITIVNLALVSYSIAIFNQNRKKMMSWRVLAFLTVGVVFDVTATTSLLFLPFSLPCSGISIHIYPNLMQ